MNRNVVVTANEAGQVTNVSKNNPDYGYIRVEQMKPVFDDSGWARIRKVSALIPGTVEDLKAFGWTPGLPLPGNVVTIESLEAFNSKAPEKDYKVAGDTGVVCCLDGQPIYRRAFYTEDLAKADETVAHNNTEEIKAAYAAQQEAAADKTVDSDADLNIG